jgi:hypothetical protein
LVVSSDRRAYLSGTGSPSSEFLEKAEKEKLRFQGYRSSASRAAEIGHVFTDSAPSTVGARYHADPPAVSASNAIGDSLRMCNSCQGFTLREAIASGQRKRVRDPNFLRFFKPVGGNAATGDQAKGPEGAGFGRAEIIKEDARKRKGVPKVRREMALAFPGSITVAEQTRREGEAIVRLPNTARLRIPSDIHTAAKPTILRRPPRQSLNDKGKEAGISGKAQIDAQGSRTVHFETAEGVVEVVTGKHGVHNLTIRPSQASQSTASSVSVTRSPEGPNGLVFGEATYSSGTGQQLTLPRHQPRALAATVTDAPAAAASTSSASSSSSSSSSISSPAAGTESSQATSLAASPQDSAASHTSSRALPPLLSALPAATNLSAGSTSGASEPAPAPAAAATTVAAEPEGEARDEVADSRG